MADNKKVWVSPSSIKPDATATLDGILVNRYFLKDHNVNKIDLPSPRTNKFKGVVIHNTNRAKSEDDGRQYTAATLNDNVATRTHYYVTELSAWQNLELSDMNWSCGDKLTGEGNNGCISLEIIMDTPNQEKDLKSRDNGARLAAYILFKNGMTVNDMYTHNYFLNVRNGVKGDYMYLCTTPTPTRNCPAYIVGDWEGFRRQVEGYLKALGGRSVLKSEEIDSDSSHEDVQLVYQAVSTAARRAGLSKDSKMYGRVVKGDLYPIDRKYTIDGVVWLKHAGIQEFSMLNDEGALFRKTGVYTTKRTTATLNVRANPSSKARIVGTLPYQSIVYMIAGEKPALVDGYNWVKIIFEGKIAYVASEYLK